MTDVPHVVVPLAHEEACRDRCAPADKAAAGVAHWPVPFAPQDDTRIEERRRRTGDVVHRGQW